MNKEREQKQKKNIIRGTQLTLGQIFKKINILLRENLDADITSHFYRFYFLHLCV